MPWLAPKHRAPGVKPAPVRRKEQRQAHDRKRGREQPWRALYKDARWLRGRLEHLAAHPLCVRCEAVGHVEPATVVNHKQRHRGDETLFFDRANWESLCKRCHDGAVQREERAQDRVISDR